MIRFSALALAFALAASAAPADSQEFKAGDIRIEKPWSRATPIGAEVSAGYCIIRNDGAKPDRLTGGTAEFADVEIHQTKSEEGVTEMRELKTGLNIPAHGSVGLAPGGYHLMFTHLSQALTKGQTLKATLTFEHAGDVEVEFKVVAPGASGPGMKGGDMKDMKM
jgi:periplasmic copper chaperone A